MPLTVASAPPTQALAAAPAPPTQERPSAMPPPALPASAERRRSLDHSARVDASTLDGSSSLGGHTDEEMFRSFHASLRQRQGPPAPVAGHRDGGRDNRGMLFLFF